MSWERYGRDLAVRLERAEAESGVMTFGGTDDIPGGSIVRRFGSVIARIDPAGRVSNVKCLGLEEPATKTAIDEICAAFQGIGAAFLVYLSPAARPPEVEAMLESKGFTRARPSAKLVRRTEAPPDATPTDLEIVEANEGDDTRIAAVLAGGFGMPAQRGKIVSSTLGKPGWCWFLALDGEQPVGAGALCVVEGVGWLGYGATLPSYRGRGAQTALIAARVAAAREMGCDYVTSDTWVDTAEEPVTSYRNMIRNGFHLLYVRPHFEYRFEV